MTVTPLLGAIKWVAFPFAPRGWALCNGQAMSISEHEDLFALIGTTYGGNGVTTFCLPDLRGRTPVGVGAMAEWNVSLGMQDGAESVALTQATMPGHTHTVGISEARATRTAPGPTDSVLAGGHRAFVDASLADGALGLEAVERVGGAQAHNNMQPFLTLTAVIATTGVFPSRS